MRRSLFPFVLLLLISSEIFSQNKENQAVATEKVVTGTVLLNMPVPLSPQALIGALRDTWKLKTDSVKPSDKTLIFSTPGATVMLAYLDYPVTPAEVQAAARIAWTWPSAATDVAPHRGQVVISVIGSSSRTLDLYKIFTKTAAAVLQANPSASGVFLNSQYVLSSRDFFLSGAQNMLRGEALPLYSWLHFGMLEQDGKSSGYTFGMQEFSNLDLEVLRSAHSMQEVHAALYDAALTMLQYGLQVRDGQVLTTNEGLKISVQQRAGELLEGQVLRLDF